MCNKPLPKLTSSLHITVSSGRLLFRPSRVYPKSTAGRQSLEADLISRHEVAGSSEEEPKIAVKSRILSVSDSGFPLHPLKERRKEKKTKLNLQKLSSAKKKRNIYAFLK